MYQENTGYFIWSEQEKTYLSTDQTLIINENSGKIRLSEVHSDSIPNILQAIWCRRNGSVNHEIGITKQRDEVIAKKLEVWY
ncbi:hypothetical protein ACHB4O_002423 [Listeria innocua]|uniref:hypothetical protein n=1 Tax=Enterococcus lactis TaxID=357441 RepID=UPI00237A0F03|nr:hypothetical protein [Enterococcus lactis]EKD8217461.1 hypothetical protein [Listeria innocua]